MSDPRYMHEFYPNKKSLCKTIVGDRICHERKDYIVHVRYEEKLKEQLNSDKEEE